jgi:hypothetical protein
MTEIPWLIWLLAGLLLAGLAAGLAAVVWLVARACAARRCGRQEKAERLSNEACPQGIRLAGQTVQIGHVVYKNCVTVILASAGLYLDAGAFMHRFGRRPMLIPWDHLRFQRTTTLHWQPAVVLQVVAPEVGTLVVMKTLFQRFQLFLRPGVIDAEEVFTSEAAP